MFFPAQVHPNTREAPTDGVHVTPLARKQKCLLGNVFLGRQSGDYRSATYFERIYPCICSSSETMTIAGCSGGWIVGDHKDKDRSSLRASCRMQRSFAGSRLHMSSTRLTAILSELATACYVLCIVRLAGHLSLTIFLETSNSFETLMFLTCLIQTGLTPGLDSGPTQRSDLLPRRDGTSLRSYCISGRTRPRTDL